MRKIIICFLLGMMPLLLSAEQWRLHPTFDGNVERIIDTPDYTYILSYNQIYMPNSNDNSSKSISLYRYDKKEEELEWINTQNGLSEVVVHTAEYNVAKKYLFIAYPNGNIDLLYDDGSVVNIPGLMLANERYPVEVNAATFYPADNKIYVATRFGYIVIDDKTCEIDYSRNFNVAFNGVGRVGDNLVLTNSDGLYIGKITDVDFSSFRKIEGYRDVYRLLPLSDNRLIINQIFGWDGEIRCIELDKDGKESDSRLIKFYIKSLEYSSQGITVSGFDELWQIDKDLNLTHIIKDDSDKDSRLAAWNLKDYFISGDRTGIYVKNYKDGKWIIKSGGLRPNASSAFKSDNMVYHQDYGLLVRNHGINNKFSSMEVDAVDVVSSLRSLTWRPLSPAYRYPTPMLEQWNPNGIAIDPVEKNMAYSGSPLHGLLKLDLENPENSLRLGRANDPGNIGDKFVVVQREFTQFSNLCFFSSPQFDVYGNLWTSWFDHDLLEAEQDALEILYWSKEDRLASKDASSYRPLKRWKIEHAGASKNQMLVSLNSSANKNILMYNPGTWAGGFIFIDHKGTLDNRGDDERVDIESVIDQDGSKIEYAYVKSYYEDTSTGQVWIGHDEGVFYFRPSEIMKTGGRVTRIKVSRNDGTNLADYLLDGVSVNCILADNSGRKWFATGGGGVVVTSSDGTEVLKTYTSDNSDLPDNNVYAICYNPENNSMMISTDKGLAELFLSTAAGDSSDSRIKAYPNPVRPDYFGYVNIEGVSDNALIKIVDASGNLIKELGFAAGGEARWDLTNLNTKRVPGGVYYILASGSADGDGFSKVGKILVVN